MKLLLDENLSRRLVPFLQHEFPGSSQVTLLGLESSSDQDIWLRAKNDVFKHRQIIGEHKVLMHHADTGSHRFAW